MTPIPLSPFRADSTTTVVSRCNTTTLAGQPQPLGRRPFGQLPRQLRIKGIGRAVSRPHLVTSSVTVVFFPLRDDTDKLTVPNIPPVTTSQLPRCQWG